MTSGVDVQGFTANTIVFDLKQSKHIFRLWPDLRRSILFWFKAQKYVFVPRAKSSVAILNMVTWRFRTITIFHLFFVHIIGRGSVRTHNQRILTVGRSISDQPVFCWPSCANSVYERYPNFHCKLYWNEDSEDDCKMAVAYWLLVTPKAHTYLESLHYTICNETFIYPGVPP